MSVTRLNGDDLFVVLIDPQAYFLDRLHGDAEPVITRLEQLLIVAEWFALPVVATLEKPVGKKGELPERLANVFPGSGRIVAKQSFDLCAESAVETALADLKRRQCVVAGGETDVCVLQSTLGLLSRGHEVFLLEDCLFSSEPHTRPALDRMYQAGAVPCTFKMVYYELLGTVDPIRWRQQRQAALEKGFVDVESLPVRHPSG